YRSAARCSFPYLSFSPHQLHNPALHSFPTRRSSDLNARNKLVCLALALALLLGCALGAWPAGARSLAWENPFTDVEESDWFYPQDRKSTRLNSSHVSISYAVFCLKKKKNNLTQRTHR